MPIKSWDIFCRVVDNFGDIGVSWRLARQLATEHAEHAAKVRLWVDDLASLHAMWPEVDVAAREQVVALVEIFHWTGDFAGVRPATVVIEAFGCGLPQAYVQRIVDARTDTLWITLEYLSAETWVASHHGLPSPHPRWPVRRYFFFPGFTPGTGGVLHEAGLWIRRDAFNAAARGDFWRALAFQPPAADSLMVSMFAYEAAPLEELLSVWEHGAEKMVVVIPAGQLGARAAQFMGAGAHTVPAALSRGALEVRMAPFLPQPVYDQLLWTCDVNFVRGEDSFVRAQWAGWPFVWHAYPQKDEAHTAKLDAFLARYCAQLQGDAAHAVTQFWRAWNRAGDTAATLAQAWPAFRAQAASQRHGLVGWTRQLASIGDLASNLARFCENKL